MTISEQVAEFEAGHLEDEKARAEGVQPSRYPARFAEMKAAAKEAHAPYPPHLAAEIAACKASAMAYANEPAALRPISSTERVIDKVYDTLGSSRRGQGVEPEAPAPRIGGDPPEPEMGMVYTFDKWTAMVCALPCPWPNDMKEVRAPWGGPVIWRRGGAE